MSEVGSMTREHEASSGEVNNERSRRNKTTRKEREVKMAKHDSVGEQWDTYVKRLQNYFVANDIGAEAKKRAILSICGVITYQLIRNLSTPTKPSDLSYEDLVKLVREHCHPRRLEIVQCFHFNSRVRQSNETIALL